MKPNIAEEWQKQVDHFEEMYKLEHREKSALKREVWKQAEVINGMERKIDELKMELQNYKWAHGELRNDKERQAEEIERLKEFIATIVNSYHHVLTFDLTQEGIRLVQGEALRRDTPCD